MVLTISEYLTTSEQATLATLYKDKKVLITGAAGFIGSHLSWLTTALGADVVGVDNFLTGRATNLSALENTPNFKFVKADVISEPTTYLPNNWTPDWILHFASPASPPRYQAHPIATYQVNSQATHLLLNYLHQQQPQGRLLFASTSEVYGDPKEHPQSESYWGNVNPNGARSCYDEAKRLGETMCGVFHRDLGLDTRLVRIFNTYGPNMDPTDGRVMPQFITEVLSNQPCTVYGTGQQTRSYCYATDLVRGIITYLAAPDLAGETINLGNPAELTILETAQAVTAVITGRSAAEIAWQPLPKDDPTRRQPDITKARQLLNWEPRVSLQEGLAKTVEYFRTLSATTSAPTA